MGPEQGGGERGWVYSPNNREDGSTVRGREGKGTKAHLGHVTFEDAYPAPVCLSPTVCHERPAGLSAPGSQNHGRPNQGWLP